MNNVVFLEHPKLHFGIIITDEVCYVQYNRRLMLVKVIVHLKCWIRTISKWEQRGTLVRGISTFRGAGNPCEAAYS